MIHEETFRGSGKPCPIGNLRESFDNSLRQEAAKVVDSTKDVPSSLDDLLKFGCLLREQ